MPFLNLDDNFADHPKIDGLSDGAFRLHVSGMLYAAKHMTDGKVPVERVDRLMRRYKRTYLPSSSRPASGDQRTRDTQSTTFSTGIGPRRRLRPTAPESRRLAPQQARRGAGAMELRIANMANRMAIAIGRCHVREMAHSTPLQTTNAAAVWSVVSRGPVKSKVT